MTFDAHANLAITTVATAPSPATSGTSLVVEAGTGSYFPAPPFNATVWPQNTIPTPANAEVVRVTGVSTDTLTFARATNTEPNAIGPIAIAAGYQIANSVSAKDFVDLQTAFDPAGSAATAQSNAEAFATSAASAAQTAAEAASIPAGELGAANGVATLDSGTHLPVAQLPSSVVSVSVLEPGNLGSTHTLDFSGKQQMLVLKGTLNANCAITVANYVAGCQAVLLLTQDGTGGRTLSVSDGTPASVTMPPSAGALGVVWVYCPDSSTVDVATTTGPPGPQGPQGSIGSTGPTGPTGPAGSPAVVGTVTQTATPSIDTDNMNVASITGLAQAITSMTTNLTGTPVDGQTLVVRITDNGTARAITWGSKFEPSTVSLPTTTVVSTMLIVGFMWNTVTSKWHCVGVA